MEATDDPVVRPAELKYTKPQRGLESNPGKTAEMFSNTHPYYPNSCTSCPFNKSFKNKATSFFRNEKKHCNTYSKINGVIRYSNQDNIIIQAKSNIKKLFDDIKTYGHPTDASPILLGNFPKDIIQKIKENGIELSSAAIYTSPKRLLHHRGGQKAERDKEVSFDDSYNELAMKPFTKLLEAINKQQVVNFEYCKFQDSKPTQNKVSPLYLKQYQLRWYLMASYIGNPNIYTFALDRMLHLENDAETPYEPTNVDFEHYFDDIIGVTNYQDKPAEHIEIWVKNKELPYVLSKPLHRSQQLLQKDVNGGALITIDVKRNTELKQAILSYGGFMEVMKPMDLRKEIDEQATMMRHVYETPEPG